MRRGFRFAIIVLAASSLAGCQGNEKAAIGAAAGAVVGGAIGTAIGSSSRDRTRNAAIGAAIGTAVGLGIGAYLDEQDRRRQIAAAYVATTTDRPSSWSDPRKGTAGRVEPIGYASTRSDGWRCKTVRYQETAADGRTRTGETQACIDQNGNLRV